MIIRWRNIYSGEIGYVKSVDYLRRHFNNTFNVSEAKHYKEDTALKTIDKLIEYGEGVNNVFDTLDEV